VGVLLEMRKAFSVISIPFQLRDFFMHQLEKEKEEKESKYISVLLYPNFFFITGIGCISNNLILKMFYLCN
jgi:hypothetical protein